MDVSSLLERSGSLLSHMREVGYSDGYIDKVAREVRWLVANGDEYEGYAEALAAREGESDKEATRKSRRIAMGIVEDFDERGILPTFGRRGPARPRSSYSRLCEGMASVVDAYLERAATGGDVSEGTARHHASVASSFLLSMQEMGRTCLAEVTEEDVLSRLTDDDGGPAVSQGTTCHLLAVLGSDLGALSEEARRVAALVPRVAATRKVVDYLRPNEVESIRSALGDGGDGISLRDRAMVTLLLHTGLRSCDVCGLRLGEIDWELEEIRIEQRKTGAPLSLPLTPTIGNAIFDYLDAERPDTGDDHVFLAVFRPHGPIGHGALYRAVGGVLDAAGVRVGDGRRRGTHIFRHNAATTMVAAGVQPAVAGAVLGHRDPGSIATYLHADVAHLRGCALDLGRLVPTEGVFDL